MDLMTRTFGVEIELGSSITAGELAARITEAGISCHAEDYNHYTRPTWKIVHDGSVREMPSMHWGMEVVSPVLAGADGIAQVEKVCAVLVAQGCIINPTCGLHVHVGASDLNIDNFRSLVRSFNHFEPVMDSFMPVSRRLDNNSYTKKLMKPNVFINRAEFDLAVKNSSTISKLIKVISNGDRYLKMNLTSYWRHQTIEFRHHSGTVEGIKVINWIRFCLLFVQASKLSGKVAKGTPTLASLTSSLFRRLATVSTIATQSRAFYITRQQKFAGRAAA